MDNHVKNKKYGNVVSISSLTGEYAAQKFKNFCSSSLWTCLHHMVILRSQNKITDFSMILAWASPFKLLEMAIDATSTLTLTAQGSTLDIRVIIFIMAVDP